MSIRVDNGTDRAQVFSVFHRPRRTFASLKNMTLDYFWEKRMFFWHVFCCNFSPKGKIMPKVKSPGISNAGLYQNVRVGQYR